MTKIIFLGYVKIFLTSLALIVSFYKFSPSLIGETAQILVIRDLLLILLVATGVDQLQRYKAENYNKKIIKQFSENVIPFILIINILSLCYLLISNFDIYIILIFLFNTNFAAFIFLGNRFWLCCLEDYYKFEIIVIAGALIYLFSLILYSGPDDSVINYLLISTLRIFVVFFCLGIFTKFVFVSKVLRINIGNSFYYLASQVVEFLIQNWHIFISSFGIISTFELGGFVRIKIYLVKFLPLFQK